MGDSKEKILSDWNALQQMGGKPYLPLIFEDIDELYRFLKEKGSAQGKISRKEHINKVEDIDLEKLENVERNTALLRQKAAVKKIVTKNLENGVSPQ